MRTWPAWGMCLLSGCLAIWPGAPAIPLNGSTSFEPSQGVPWPSPAPSSAPPEGPERTIERAVLGLANIERRSRGLQTWFESENLVAAARFRSQDMASRQYFSHVDPDGVGPFDVLKRMGATYRMAGENIAWNTAAVSEAAHAAMDAWMKSSGHRDNLLATGFRQTGVGVAMGTDERWIFTQVFTD